MTKFEQKILFVTGKGGVGKSTVAATLAHYLAQTGKKTLLVELGEYSFYRDYFDLPTLEYTPQMINPNLSCALWSGRLCLREYLIYLLKFESVYNLLFNNHLAKTLIDIAPGLSELAILGKITSGIRHLTSPLDYDHIVVDTYSMGHALALFRAPLGLTSAFHLGPLGEQTKQITEILKNSQLCHYFIVTLPEELPILEATELAQIIKSDLGQSPTFILNKTVPTTLRRVLQEHPNISTPNPFVQYLIDFNHRHNQYLNRLKEEKETRIFQLPLVLTTESNILMNQLTTALRLENENTL